MKLKLTRHVQDMIQYRGLNLDHIKAALREPDETEDTYEGKKLARKAVDDRTIEVIYYREPFRDKKNEYLIITEYYL